MPLLPTRTLIATGVALLVVVGLVVAILAWGQARYDAGKSKSDAQWQEASARLEATAREAGTTASAIETIRVREYNALVAEEKDLIDEAVADGRSPLDVLFGNGGVRDDESSNTR